MDNSYDENTRFGLDGVVNQPNPGFGLGVPTDEELNQYNNQRAMASGIDGPVQYAHELETSRMDRANSLLDSLKTMKERQEYEVQQNELDAQKEQIQTETILRNQTALEVDKEKINMQYVALQRQQIRVEDRQLDPGLIEKVKKAGKAAVIAALITVGAFGIGKGAQIVLTKPEYVPEQTPQSVELQENINNAENINEVVDAINENKAQQIESGITTHPEHVIDVHNQKVEEAKEEKEQKEKQMQVLREETIENDTMSDSMKSFVNEVNRQKVIKIESGITVNPEQVINEQSYDGPRR